MSATARRFLPPEWAPQSGVLLTWPHDQTDFAPWLRDVDVVFADIAHQASESETVVVSCRDAQHRCHVAGLLQQRGVCGERVRLFDVPANDVWVRDHGPVTVLENHTPRLLDFVFNGWGGKFSADLDNEVTRRLHAAGAFRNTPCEPIDLVLEGGSIEVDGQGTLLTTTRCLLAPTRNPDLGKTALEERLMRLLGVERVLWLEHGYVDGDDTDGHVDTLARFCSANTICYVSCDDPNHAQYVELREMENELRAFRSMHGAPYRLVPLPSPRPIRGPDGHPLPATYANFVILNHAVLAPVYDDRADEVALTTLRNCFPSRKICPVNALPLIQQYGSLHCVTMQLPEGVL